MQTFNEAAKSEKQGVRRATGSAKIMFCADGGRTRLAYLNQIWPCRVLLPHRSPNRPTEAIIANTAGGVVGGDKITNKLVVRRGARATFTTQAAEKVYRSDGSDSYVSTEVSVDASSSAEWIPQETILFERARLRRLNQFDVQKGSVLLTGDITVFGRQASGETFKNGFLHDIWNVYNEGKLTWSDRLRIDSGLGAQHRQPFAFADAAAVALLICFTPNPRILRDCGRGLLQGSQFGGFTIVRGITIGRFICNDAAKLRQLIADIWIGLRRAAGLSGTQMPRVWNL